MTDQTAPMGQTAILRQMVRETGVFRCLECGKCTAICPVSRYDQGFSPRRTVGRALMRHDQALLSDDRLWTCLTCLHCSQVCPAGVTYPDLTLSVRTEARRLGAATVCTHGEAIHAWMRMMMQPKLQQDRLGWLGSSEFRVPSSELRNSQPEIQNSELRTRDDSDMLYFVGCAPYYGALFKPLGVDGEGIARATMRVLNALGIEPQVLADERCCGHDLLWEGDVEGFRTLAELNAALIRDSGARHVVTACPECARALKIDYPAHGIQLGVEVLHLAELLASSEFRVPSSELNDPQFGTRDPKLEAQNSKLRTQGPKLVTFHDPCRLGRHMGVYDAPRQAIRRLGLTLIEMPRNRANALCCGTNGWTHCAVANKAIQVDRLREARATGAELLVTACVKCQIHLRCAMQDQLLAEQISIEIKDLATLVAEALEDGGTREIEREWL
jgi:heterodisulfide reductase subunit D